MSFREGCSGALRSIWRSQGTGKGCNVLLFALLICSCAPVPALRVFDDGDPRVNPCVRARCASAFGFDCHNVAHGQAQCWSGTEATDIQPVVAETVAGMPLWCVDGMGTAATLGTPLGIAATSFDEIYVAFDHNVKRITPDGTIAPFAGLCRTPGDATGQGTIARFDITSGLALDNSNFLYIGDVNNYKIKKISPSGLVTEFAGSGSQALTDGTGAGASFHTLFSFAIDGTDHVYVGDQYALRKITPLGAVYTVAGNSGTGFADGVGTLATFDKIRGLALDTNGDIFVSSGSRIRKFNPSSGNVTTFAGAEIGNANTALGTYARFHTLWGMAIDSSTNDIYVMDQRHFMVRKVTPTAAVSIFSGYQYRAALQDGPGSVAWFHYPREVAIGSAGNLWVADTSNYVVRKVLLSDSTTTTFVGKSPHSNGPGPEATFRWIEGMTLWDQHLLVTNTITNVIRKVDRGTGQVSHLSGRGTLALGFYAEGVDDLATYKYPISLLVGAGGFVYVSDRDNNRIRKIDASGSSTAFLGSGSAGTVDGYGVTCELNRPTGMVQLGSDVFFINYGDHRLRKFTPTGLVTTVAGSGSGGLQDGVGTVGTRFNYPYQICAWQGNIYIPDTGNHVIRKVTPDGRAYRVSGAGAQGLINGAEGTGRWQGPKGCTVGPDNHLYIADTGNHAIRKLSPGHTSSTVWGTGSVGYVDGRLDQISTPEFESPTSIVYDTDFGFFWIADNGENHVKIRRVALPPKDLGFYGFV